jgi:ABC-type Mn2+/Zn2+ transport system ATPase subunit
LSLVLTSAVIGYGRKILFSAVDAGIHRGDVIFLSGPNGSGKSTLAKALLGVLPLIAGRRQCSFARLAYVPQSSQFETQYPITVAELVEQGLPEPLLLMACSPAARKQRARQVAEIINKMQLSACANLLLREVSGGQLQRALIARALVCEPDFLLLDEPFSNLDRSGRSETAQLLRSYARPDTALCIIDHGDGLQHIFYNRVWEIDQGRLVARVKTP